MAQRSISHANGDVFGWSGSVCSAEQTSQATVQNGQDKKTGDNCDWNSDLEVTAVPVGENIPPIPFIAVAVLYFVMRREQLMRKRNTYFTESTKSTLTPIRQHTAQPDTAI
ncbi:hypothetical protein MPER_14428 [Moniliophthora perniciosa FA553]|nr:hypothetical protein MPER_14428 [Moniliophthora perniciosa FA553]